jgi:O-antigen/teichoic acid export membrane protein
VSTTSPAAESDVLAVAKGAGFLASGRAFSSVVRLITAVLLARWLGAEGYGLYILCISVAFAASSVASLGLDVAMERYIAVAARRQDDASARGTLQIGVLGTLIPGLVVAGILIVLAEAIAVHLFDDADLTPLMGLSAALAVVIGMSTLLVAVLVGSKRIDQSALADHVMQPLARLGFLLLLAPLGMTPFRAGVALLLSYLVSVGAMLTFIDRKIPLAGLVKPADRDVRGITAFAFPFWFTGFLRILRTRIQPLLLGVVGTVANVGVFAVVTSASALGRLANASISTALRPTLAELHDVGDAKEVGRLYATTTRWTLAVSLPVFVFIALVPDSLLGLFGPGFETGVTALVIAASAEVVNGATGMCGPIIAMSGYNKLKVANATAWMIVSLLANVIMIPLWGVNGAAIAILVSTTSINAIRVVELWILMRILPWDAHSWKPFAAAAGAAAVAWPAVALLPDRMALPLLVAVAVGIGAVFVVLVVLLGLEPDDRKIVDRLAQRAGRMWGRVRRRPAPRPDVDEASDPWS